MTDRNELLQNYIDQVITPDQLQELQELLKNDPTARRDLLLYSQLDIAIRDYVLFHNYMDEPAHENTPAPVDPDSGRKSETEVEVLDKLLRRIFPGPNPGPSR